MEQQTRGTNKKRRNKKENKQKETDITILIRNVRIRHIQRGTQSRERGEKNKNRTK
jgi:hypothetical protein